ncbi:DNA sulfur modification protein DndB [Desulfofustis glycolicus]|uniref:DNA sulfur modification protein DndB n=1 Tax=Desulfofustis glycolicus DSM 9705 TaxID=1121409 RepID=A0A1M5UJU7_9BACT|nr:DNA sulfur modification protein DndB [Desulfofustis glycolicus]SHH63352.1 DNA sulfur modification protein DndB [Desulfofustis glycolicus DSM 9705]
MSDPFEYVFPCIRGMQAKSEYFVSMCPLRLIPKIFLFNEEELVPELRAQRFLNKARLPDMSRYLLENKDSYVFSAITASIDGEVKFEPIEASDNGKRIGFLHIPMSAQFIINDGQHRRAAIEMAIREEPALADESIAVVFFMDKGLKRCQQMFADLNRYAIRPSKSLGVLYDHRDEMAEIARTVAFKAEAFNGVVEMEKSTLSPRASRLFTLSSIYNANSALLSNIESGGFDDKVTMAIEFWDEASKHIREWRLVKNRKITSGDVRRDFIHSHAVVLQAIGYVGNTLLKNGLKNWKAKIKTISTIDWARSNTKQWEGRAMIGGKVSKAHHNVTLTANAIKKHIGLQLTPEEQRVEDAFHRGDYEG